jgi:hypothetical protein
VYQIDPIIKEITVARKTAVKLIFVKLSIKNNKD